MDVAIFLKQFYSKKVWSGNEDCEPVTWTECNLVEYEVPFTVPKMECTEKGNNIPWKDCRTKQKTKMVSNMTCTPQTKVECLPVVKELCTTIKWTESLQEKNETCNNTKSWQPFQEVSHKKKCLLPDKETPLPTKPLEKLEPKEKVY